MTHAAAATPAPHVPRRRPSVPAAGERAGTASGVVGALLLVPFLASLRTFTARRTDVANWRWTGTLVMGAIGIAMLALAGALVAGAFLLVVLWVVALAGTIVRGDHSRSEEGS